MYLHSVIKVCDITGRLKQKETDTIYCSKGKLACHCRQSYSIYKNLYKSLKIIKSKFCEIAKYSIRQTKLASTYMSESIPITQMYRILYRARQDE